MTFKELFPTFVAGTKIKRKPWKGYWVYKFGTIEMHTKDGRVIDFLDSEDILFTISHFLENDWEVYNDEEVSKED